MNEHTLSELGPNRHEQKVTVNHVRACTVGCKINNKPLRNHHYKKSTVAIRVRGNSTSVALIKKFLKIDYILEHKINDCYRSIVFASTTELEPCG